VAKTVDVPITEFIPRFYFPIFRPASRLKGEESTGITFYRVRHVEVTTGTSGKTKTLHELAVSLGADSISQSLTYEPAALARLLAKVAYGMAIGHLGPDAFGRVDVLPAIMGTANDVGTWVGGVETALLPESKELHQIQVFTEGRAVRVRVKLLALLGGPEYEVLVGELAESVIPPEQEGENPFDPPPCLAEPE
jgi:hypothetical protein